MPVRSLERPLPKWCFFPLGIAFFCLLLPPAAQADQLSDAQEWYESECSDRSSTLFASDDSDAVLRSLTTANERTGEPVFLGWRALIGLCVGSKTAQQDLDTFKSIGKGLDPALDARIDLEVGWRNGSCSAAARSAQSLLKAGVPTGYDAYAVLDLLVTCGDAEWSARTDSCDTIVVAADECAKHNHGLAPYEKEVQECRAIEDAKAAIAQQNEKERLAREEAERKRAAREAEEAARVAEEEAQEAARIAEEERTARLAAEETAQKDRAVARKQLRELMPDYERAKAALGAEKKHGAPGFILLATGFGGGAALAGVGMSKVAEASLAQTAAAEADTGSVYESEVSKLESANAALGASLGTASALMTAGVVGAILTASRAKKRKALEQKYRAMREAREDLEEKTQ